MPIRSTILMLLLLALLSAGGCTGNKAAELFETAKFEELQNNKDHARELYEEIVKKHPKSPEAAKAQERLQSLKEGR